MEGIESQLNPRLIFSSLSQPNLILLS